MSKWLSQSPHGTHLLKAGEEPHTPMMLSLISVKGRSTLTVQNTNPRKGGNSVDEGPRRFETYPIGGSSDPQAPIMVNSEQNHIAVCRTLTPRGYHCGE